MVPAANEATKLKGDQPAGIRWVAFLQLMFCNRVTSPTSSADRLVSLIGDDSMVGKHRGCCGSPEDSSCAIITTISIFGTTSAVAFVLTVFRCIAQPQLTWEGILHLLPSWIGFTCLAALYAPVVHFLKVPVFKCAGFRDESIVLARGRRDTWTADTVHGFINEYGERRVKILDVLSRRLSALMAALLNAVMLVNLNDEGLIGMKSRAVQGFVIYGIPIAVCALLLRADDVAFFAPYFFAPARIRDGTMGRINLIMVYTSGLACNPTAMLLLTALPERTSAGHATPYSVLVLLLTLTFPIADMMSEVVGGFFGRLEFNVYGFGDINKKTVEGVIACWLTAFTANEALMRCISSTAGGFPIDSFVVSSVEGLNVILATVITLGETFALRGTDDGVVPLLVSATILALWRW